MKHYVCRASNCIRQNAGDNEKVFVLTNLFVMVYFAEINDSEWKVHKSVKLIR